MIYLVAVTWAAAKLTKSQAITTAILAVLAFDFLFVPPFFTFRVSDLQYLVTFVVMLGVGIIISDLVARLHAHSRVLSDREQRTARLYELVNKLSEAATLPEAAQVIVDQIRQTFNMGSRILFPRGESLESMPKDEILTEKDIGTALWAFRNQQNAGRETDTLPGSEWLFCPLKAGSSCIGVLAIQPGQRELDRSKLSLLEAFATNAALAIQRLLSEEESKQSYLRVEQEQIKGVFLSSISHDLRTPLASIEGAAAAIVANGSVSQDETLDLAKDIIEESRRLSGMIRNVLDVTRLGNDGVALNSDWYSVEELIGGALYRVDKLLGERQISLSIPHDLPLVWVDGTLMEQLFVNLLENLSYHTPVGTGAAITAAVQNGEIVIDFADRGTGLSSKVLESLFMPNIPVRPRQSRGATAGFGLGLSICGSIAKAHKGRISAHNGREGGAVFQLVLPIKSPPSEVVNE